jgi:hypothetical protein
VASEAICGARVVPGLSPGRVVGIRNDDVLVKACTKQVCIAVVGAPLISNTINRSVRVTDQQPRFEPPAAECVAAEMRFRSDGGGGV